MNIIQVHPAGWGFREAGGAATFTPWGCNYYDPFTGWPPRLWEQFDPTRVAAHFDDIRGIGGNVIRVFSTLANVLAGPDQVSASGLAKMARMLDLAGERGLRVIYSGPGLWEGAPPWWTENYLYEAYARPDLIAIQQVAWRGIGSALRGHPALMAYELHNEPFSPWRVSAPLREQWALWRARFGPRAPEDLPAPCEPLFADWHVDFQRFREHIADAYVARMVEAIREVDDTHLVTIGLHQKSAPFDWYPPDPYTGFNPHRLADRIDYTSLHFYPHHPFHPNIYRDPCETPEGMTETLCHARAVLRYAHSAGKPVVMEECGWYGGGSPLTMNRELPARSEGEQAAYCRRLVESTAGDACGWLFWPYRDTPSSLDISRRGGLFNPEGALKEWGRDFSRMAKGITGAIPTRVPGTRTLPLSWRELVTDPEAVKACRARYLDEFRRGEVVDFTIDAQ